MLAKEGHPLRQLNTLKVKSENRLAPTPDKLNDDSPNMIDANNMDVSLFDKAKKLDQIASNEYIVDGSVKAGGERRVVPTASSGAVAPRRATSLKR